MRCEQTLTQSLSYGPFTRSRRVASCSPLGAEEWAEETNVLRAQAACLCNRGRNFCLRRPSLSIFEQKTAKFMGGFLLRARGLLGKQESFKFRKLGL